MKVKYIFANYGKYIDTATSVVYTLVKINNKRKDDYEMKKLPRTELEIMKFIWSKKDKVSTKDVAIHMEEVLEWKLSTTSKTLSRLVEKDFLVAEKIGKQSYYSPIVEEDDYLKFETKEFFSYLHGKSLKSIISTLEESDEITNEDLDELEKWIKNR